MDGDGVVGGEVAEAEEGEDDEGALRRPTTVMRYAICNMHVELMIWYDGHIDRRPRTALSCGEVVCRYPLFIATGGEVSRFWTALRGVK